MSGAVFGTSVRRLEDRPLITGRGAYVADMKLPNMLHAAVLRSPHAHARIRSIDLRAALALPGVVAAYANEDLGVAAGDVPLLQPNPLLTPRMPRVLARDEVRHAGEAVALVVAEDRYVAEDALEVIEVDYEPLPAVVDAARGIQDGAPRVHRDIPNNLAARFSLGYGDIERAFASADAVLKERLKVHRGGGFAMEGRAVLAQHDPASESITMWSATQSPYLVRRIACQMLGLAEWQLRVIAPKDVGGGFGPKAIPYPEEVLIPFAARALGRPVRWVEDRYEHFLATNQERDQYHDLELAVTRDGKILGLRDAIVFDTGAYVPWGLVEPWLTVTSLPGPYRIPALSVTVNVVYTNKVPVTPVRGAGRPQAVFAVERMLDRTARELGLDAAEVRFRNFVQPEEMPYEVGLIFRDGAPMTYDSGDYPACLRQALELANYDGIKREQAQLRERGRYVGIGMACYVEGTGIGPFEGAILRVDASGKVLLTTGASPHGQGHRTTLTQIVAEELGVDVENVSVITGDTGAIPFGVGTFASRTAVNAGNSVKLAAQEVREKAFNVAASMLEANKDDLAIERGKIFVRGTPDRSVDLGSIAVIASGDKPGYTLPPGVQPGLQATQYFSPGQAAYCSGAHVVVAEVDVSTGDVKLLEYAVAHDCGRVINPLIVEGQIQGGIAQGVGNGFYEELIFDDQGQLLSGSFMDYLLPTAGEVPDAKIAHVEVLCPLNPLGVKGTGEGGTIPAGAAFAAAVEDALAPFGVSVREIPLSPNKVRRLLEEAAGAATHRADAG